jgi:hypothetical protein
MPEQNFQDKKCKEFSPLGLRQKAMVEKSFSNNFLQR